LSEFPEDKLVRLELVLVGQSIGVLERLSESRSQFKDSGRRSRERVALLPEEDIVLDPVLGQREAFSQSSVLVGFGEQPGCVHKVLALEVLCDLLVPERNISGAVVDNGSELGVFGQVVHEVFHSVNAGNEVRNAVFIGLETERSKGQP
jgi:hypothetical protein